MLTERELIREIRAAAARAADAQGHAAKVGRRRSGVALGIGDDCALLRLPAGHETLITTDFSLEDVHFRRAWHPAESVGHRCLARGLSDIAAMGGVPVAAFLSLALPPGLEQSWVDGFLRGLLALARKFEVILAGGDTAQSPADTPNRAPTKGRLTRHEAGGKILADIVVVGSVPRGNAVLRSGARVGDDIFVTDSLGAAAAVLHRMMRADTGAQGRSKTGLHTAARLRRGTSEQKHFFPIPRVAVGRWLRERGLPSAMIDISDGLSTDLSHICEESGVGAWIAEAAVPVAAGATFAEAVSGGDDYELLFTAPASKHGRIPDRIAGVSVRWIGTITKAPKMWLVAPDMKSRRELKPHGWEHFRK